MATNNTNGSDILNSDVYNLAGMVNNLAKSYIPEMTEDTLSVGLPGFIIALETTKLKTNAIMTGALSNEVFPQRALLDRNVITHAIMQGVTGINAIPSQMTVIIGLLEEDFNKYASNTDNFQEFIFDKYCPIKIEDEFDFYLDYDIILRRSKSSAGTDIYTATYDLPSDRNQYNRISKIDNPYAKQPYITRVGDSNYIFLQTVMHQVTIDRQYTQFISSNVVDNRTIVFEFDEMQQLADFEVRVTEPNGNVVYLTPVFEGAAMDTDIEKYCEYTYVNTNTIRISFVRSSYMPGLNATAEITIKTTKGSEGIFNYNSASFANYASETYGYPSGINILIRPNTASTGGSDRKSIEELHKILPKQILMNGAITTETDLTNYFNLINTDYEKMIMMRKSDSQIERVWYAYMLMKNAEGNVVPTNTITVDIYDTELPVITEDGNYVLPAGSIIIYDTEKRLGTITHNPDKVITAPFAYFMLYTIQINMDPLFTSFFMTTINQNSYPTYSWINTEASVQFMIDSFMFKRSMLENTNKYYLTFTTTQNINAPEDMYIIEKDPVTGEEIITNNMKCFLVLYNNGEPYRYTEATLTAADLTYYKFDWQVELTTSNKFDTSNKLMLTDLYVANTRTKLYGYFPEYVEAYVYILAKSEYIGTSNRYDLDAIISDGSGVAVLKNYGVTNKFEIHGGLNLYEDYSGILHSTINARVNPEIESSNIYNLQGIPVIGYNYVTDTVMGASHFEEFLNAMSEKKAYMDDALVLLENSFDLDYKFYNTYGPALLYSIDSEGERTGSGNLQHGIGRVDITMHFTLSLKSSSDIYTKDNITKYIKNYIENLSVTNEDIDISNMMSDVRVEFENLINYIDYEGFNYFDSNTHHLYWNDPSEFVTFPPEFVNIRTTVDEAGETVPDIVIDVI